MPTELNREQNAHVFLIANSLFPYGYDAVRVLSLPRGASYRGRFDKKFVSDQIKNEYKNIRKQSGFYVFRNYSTGQLVPLMHITIEKISKIGDIFFIEYNTGDLLDFSPDQAKLIQQVEGFNDQFSRTHQTELTDNVGGRHLRPLLMMSRLSPNFESEVRTISDNPFDQETTRWSAIAKFIGSIDEYKYVPFIKVVGITKSDSSELAPVSGNFALESGSDYKIQIAHTFEYDSKDLHGVSANETDRAVEFKEKASFQIKLNGDTRAINIQSPSIYITGPYDVNYIHFSTRDEPSVRVANFELDYVNKPEKAINLDTRIPLTFRVFIKHGFPTGRLLFIIAILAIYFVPNIFPIVLQYLHIPERVLQDLAVIAVSLTAFDLLNEIRKRRET